MSLATSKYATAELGLKAAERERVSVVQARFVVDWYSVSRDPARSPRNKIGRGHDGDRRLVPLLRGRYKPRDDVLQLPHMLDETERRPETT